MRLLLNRLQQSLIEPLLLAPRMVSLKHRPLVLGMVLIQLQLLAPEFALAKLRPQAPGKVPEKPKPQAPGEALAELRLLVTMLAPVMLQQQVMLVLGQPRALDLFLV